MARTFLILMVALFFTVVIRPYCGVISIFISYIMVVVQPCSLCTSNNITTLIIRNNTNNILLTSLPVTIVFPAIIQHDRTPSI